LQGKYWGQKEMGKMQKARRVVGGIRRGASVNVPAATSLFSLSLYLSLSLFCHVFVCHKT